MASLSASDLVSLVFAVNVDLPVAIERFDDICVIGQQAFIVIFELLVDDIERVDFGKIGTEILFR